MAGARQATTTPRADIPADLPADRLTEITALDGVRDGLILLARFDDSHCPEMGTDLGKHPRRRAEYAAGRALARLAMTALGVAPSPVPRNADRSPRWPDGLSGSITHSGDQVAVCMARGSARRIGIDIETGAGAHTTRSIRRMVLTVGDADLIDTLPDTDRADAARAVFSAKETLFKALFPEVGQTFWFDAARLTGPPSDRGLSLALTRQLAPALPQGMQFDIHLHRPDNDAVLSWMDG